jgi:glycosyltransferase involved in cell wall biosynthesis
VPTPPPRVTVCVCTRDQAPRLPRLLTALEQQILAPGTVQQIFAPDTFEVVIVDDGSTDETPRVLAKLAQESSLALTVIRNDVPRGPAIAHDQAWQAAHAPIVAFTQPDCVPTRWWLSVGLAAMAQPDRVGVGRVMPNPEDPKRYGRLSYRVWFDDSSLLFFRTTNVFYRREQLESVGGFRAAPVPGAQLSARGVRPVYLRRAIVYRDLPDATWSELISAQRRWADVVPLVAANRELRRPGLTAGVFVRRTHPQLLLLLAGLIGAGRDRRWLLLACPWLHHRTCVAPLCEGPRRRWLVLPGAVLTELNEVRHLAHASVKHRTLVL